MINSKKDFQDCLEKIVLPIKNMYSKNNAFLRCGNTGVSYGEKISYVEGFARPLWGLSPLWAGKGNIDGFDKIYLNGIKNGTDPNNDEYWGDIIDYDQKIVESAALALSLILARDKVWDPLTDTQKQNFQMWLFQVNNHKCCDNNWNFFPILVNVALKSVGAPYSQEKLRESLNAINSYYIGNGWYADGKSAQFDYYIAFAMHFYGLIYAKVMEKDDPKNSALFKERAMKFAKDFIYWFSNDGSAIAFGRSQTYRFAQCCFWSACLFAGIRPFPVGVMKGIISRHLKWWMNQPIFDNAGVLSIGYAYPNLNMSEEYNSSGSPYWALKSFLVLALDDDDEFFNCDALPLPQLDDIHIIKEAKMVIHRTSDNVIAYTAGQWAGFIPLHVSEKYSKFAYSTKYGFSVPRSYDAIRNAGSDSMLTFVKDNMCFVRKKCIESSITDDGTVFSKWSPCSGITVDTEIIPIKNGHIRKHMVICDSPCTAYDCSFATPDGNIDVTSKQGESVLIVNTPNQNLINQLTKINAVKYEFDSGCNVVETIIKYH